MPEKAAGTVPAADRQARKSPRTCRPFASRLQLPSLRFAAGEPVPCSLATANSQQDGLQAEIRSLIAWLRQTANREPSERGAA